MDIGYIEIVTLVLGLIMTGIAVREFRKTNRFTKYGKRARAKVIGYTEELGGDLDRYFHPVVEFRTQDERPVKQKYPIGLGNKKHKINDTIDVIYDCKNPSNIDSEVPWTRHVAWLMAAIIGVSSLFGFGYMLIV